MKTVKEIRAALTLLYNEGKPLAERSQKGELDDAGEQRLAEIADETTRLTGELAESEAREARNAAMLKDSQRFAEPAGRRSSAAPAQETRDRKDDEPAGFGRRYIDSDAFQDLKKRGGRSGGRVEFEGFRGTPEQRALVYTGGLPSGMIAAQRVPGIFAPDRMDLGVRSAFLGGTTDSNTVEYFYESSFTNNADWVPEATHSASASESPAHASVKPESAIAWLGATASVATIAHHIPVTKQTLWDEPQLQSIIETRLLQGLDEVIEDDLINGTGTPPELKGLLAFSGIQDLDATYFASNPVEGAGGPNEDFNRILRARQMIRYTGRARADFVLIHPADMERFLTQTDGHEQYLAGGPFSTGMGIQRLWGLRVIESEVITEGEPIVGDGTKAQVWDRMQSAIEVGYIDNQLIRNMQTILAETRLAFTVYRPAAFAVVELS